MKLSTFYFCPSAAISYCSFSVLGRFSFCLEIIFWVKESQWDVTTHAISVACQFWRASIWQAVTQILISNLLDSQIPVIIMITWSLKFFLYQHGGAVPLSSSTDRSAARDFFSLVFRCQNCKSTGILFIISEQKVKLLNLRLILDSMIAASWNPIMHKGHCGTISQPAHQLYRWAGIHSRIKLMVISL